jgi:putative heme-binding domain-containing protein
MPITDLEVGPDGNIYFTTGGSAANGGFYKVTWTGARPPQPDMTGVLAVVRQPQPLSSWGWANIERIKGTMGTSFGAELEKLARSSAAPTDRARAILEMQRHGAAPSIALLQTLIKDRDAGVRAAAVYVAGVQQSSDARAIAASALRDADPLVQRRAAEALVRLGLDPASPSVAPIADIYTLLGSTDRFVRYAGRLALERTPRTEWAPRVLAENEILRATEGLLALVNTRTSSADLAPIFERVVALMGRQTLTPAQKIRVLRAFQVAAAEAGGDVSDAVKKQVHDVLIGQFPARESANPADTFIGCAARWPGTTAAGCDQTMLAHHMAKVLAYTGEPTVIEKVLAVMPRGDADQPGQIDYMYALRVIDRGWTDAQKKQVIEWWGRASKWRGGSTFAGHLNNIFDATVDVFTEEEKKLAYAAAPLFAPLTPDEIAASAAGRGGRGGGGAAAAGRGAAPAPAAGTPAAGAPAPAGARAAGAAAPAGRAGGGGRGGAGLPATARQVPLDRQERYDNLVFPRGGGPGSLAGRGGAPNPAAGAQTFQQVCAECHRFGTTGSAYGPELTAIGKTMLRRDILRAVFFPDEKVDDRYQTTVLTMRDGRTIRGLAVGETGQTVSLKVAGEPQPMTIQKSDVGKRATEPSSIMPEDPPDRVGDQNLANVVAFLMAGQ